MGQIKWTERASSNLQAIFEYISKDSKIYAARFVKALIAATRKLERMPRCGREVPELENPELREVIYGNYRIIYRIAGSEDNIEILAVIHGARDIRAAIREEWEL
ncbi:MAG: type II toxin-antitoxin system RelE/ParE family toxin [Deltaproteobacteria bacterium]|nr:type II toxin-antitoxin system RelE/ParE family toxin [Deltaproteobacteria bacterium]